MKNPETCGWSINTYGVYVCRLNVKPCISCDEDYCCHDNDEFRKLYVKEKHMGQHKTNPTAIAASKGELPDKPKKISKRESERELQRMVWQRMVEVAPETAAVVAALSSAPYGGKR